MPSIKNILGEGVSQKVYSGEVVALMGNSIYMVNIDGDELRVHSGIPGDFKKGTMVIVAETNNGMFIIGLDTPRSSRITTVTVDG